MWAALSKRVGASWNKKLEEQGSRSRRKLNCPWAGAESVAIPWGHQTPSSFMFPKQICLAALQEFPCRGSQTGAAPLIPLVVSLQILRLSSYWFPRLFSLQTAITSVVWTGGEEAGLAGGPCFQDGSCEAERPGHLPQGPEAVRAGRHQRG